VAAPSPERRAAARPRRSPAGRTRPPGTGTGRASRAQARGPAQAAPAGHKPPPPGTGRARPYGSLALPRPRARPSPVPARALAPRPSPPARSPLAPRPRARPSPCPRPRSAAGSLPLAGRQRAGIRSRRSATRNRGPAGASATSVAIARNQLGLSSGATRVPGDDLDGCGGCPRIRSGCGIHSRHTKVIACGLAGMRGSSQRCRRGRPASRATLKVTALPRLPPAGLAARKDRLRQPETSPTGHYASRRPVPAGDNASRTQRQPEIDGRSPNGSRRSGTARSRTARSRTARSRTARSRTARSRTVRSRTVRSRTVRSRTARG